MKLPNGYGSVYKVSGRKLRKPWAVRITTGFIQKEDGSITQQKKLLGYYSTKTEALSALSSYNQNKYNLEYSSLTFSKCWEMWQNDKSINNLSVSTINGYKFSYKLITDEIKEMKIQDITLHTLQQLINQLSAEGKGYHTLRKLKNNIKLLYKYLIINNYTTINVAENIDIGKSPRSGNALIFTDQEINKIWDLYYENDKDLFVGTVLMLIYNGTRISEFLNLKSEDVHLEERYFEIKDSKTNAGIRNVPICEKCVKMYEKWLEYDFEYLISIDKVIRSGKRKRSKMTYANYRDSYWDQIMNKLGINKEITPHNSRKTCVSLLTKAKVQPILIKLIIGHEGALDLTEKTYTHVDIQQLIDAINLI